MDETMELINRLANERHNLYRLAAKQHLTVGQQNRLGELNGRLPTLWDTYRRELAASHYAPRFTRPFQLSGRRAA